ncbi:MAG: hypothetical protein K8T26_16695 [Lentisphaerae bacterium]|nr:hypothetical protein [Lentisphaerota bacterium]
MSRAIGMDIINLKPTSRPGHTEYSMEYHVALVRQLAGAAGVARGESKEASDYAIWDAKIRRALYDAWDFDFLWNTNDGMIDWGKVGRVTDMGHAVYATDGADQRAPQVSPFESPEEVWAFDPAKEYGFPEFGEQVRAYQAQYDKLQGQFPNQVSGGGYYKTVVSGAIATFGWDMLLVAAADAAQFSRVLERFGAYTEFYVRAWAETDIEVFIQHDDMVWTAGPFMNPTIYRQVIFPIYRRLWTHLKQRGKKVIYCSDGTYDMFMDDIVAAGADGMIFEPCNDYASVVKRFGGKRCLIGSAVDCRTMAFDPWEQVQKQVDTTLALTRGMPGIMLAVGNHIPANVTDETCSRYLAHLQANWTRG